jgi:uncharacterized membrane protein YvlD (DUF360 family)
LDGEGFNLFDLPSDFMAGNLQNHAFWLALTAAVLLTVFVWGFMQDMNRGRDGA